jgi:hypothetical protein
MFHIYQPRFLTVSHPTLWFGTSVAGVRFVFLHFLPTPAQTKWLMEELKSEEWRKVFSGFEIDG